VEHVNDKMVGFGADSIGLAEQKVANPRPQIGVFRDPSTILAPFDDLQTTRNRR
jgi:hypothetical protein